MAIEGAPVQVRNLGRRYAGGGMALDWLSLDSLSLDFPQGACCTVAR